MINSFTDHRRVLLLRYVPVVVWITVIFYLSSDQGSVSHTSRFIGPILEFLFPAATEQTLLIYHGYIRKAAHFAEYAILAFLAVRAFAASARLQKWRYAFALLLSVCIAAIDEFNQSFNPSRTGSIYDFLLDCSGGLFAIGLYFIVDSYFGSRRTTKYPSNL